MISGKMVEPYAGACHVILDASAVIALLSNEKGHEVVAPLLSKAVMGSVNVAEVARFLIERNGLTKGEVSGIVQSLIERVIPFDDALALTSAEIIHHTKSLGLSLGDRSCIALGLHTNYPIYTADKAWSNLTLGCKVVLIR